MSSTLSVPSSGCCAGHLCDDCPTCRSGHCCRGDNPGYRLPDEGSWVGPTFGEIGVLEDDGNRVTCHICGGYYRMLITHIWRMHDINAEEYKALFGLSVRQGLTSSATKRKKSAALEMGVARGYIFAHGNTSALRRVTPEQRQKAMEAAGRSQNRRKNSAAKGGIKDRICVICGAVVRKYGTKVTVVCSDACRSEHLRRLRLADNLMERPGARLRQKEASRTRGRITCRCANCGREFETPRWKARRYCDDPHCLAANRADISRRAWETRRTRSASPAGGTVPSGQPQ